MNYQAFVLLLAVGGLCLFAGLYGAIVFPQSMMNLGGVDVNPTGLVFAGLSIILIVLWRKKQI